MTILRENQAAATSTAGIFLDACWEGEVVRRSRNVMITGKTLQARGWPQGKLIGLAKAAARQLERDGLSQHAILERLDAARQSPEEYIHDRALGALALEARRQQRQEAAFADVPRLRPLPLPYRVWGEEEIDRAAREQMNAAMTLPVSVAGALMPDAHVGYGLPIGGVLATEDAVIPYAVGVDIACRMRLSVYPVSPIVLEQRPDEFRRALQDNTFFGAGVENEGRRDHEVLEDPAWQATPLLRGLRGIARKQLGTSGTGNHFVEWGTLTVIEPDERFGLEPGEYLALLSHSGSRGVGFKIANAFSELAMKRQPALDKSVRHLAWLPLGSEEGEQYWLSMELAGRFASANHAVIHWSTARAAGLKEIAVVENHHNFAWRETLVDAQGKERAAIVHRKGATPAGEGVLGVIPGSMADPGFVVRGRGDVSALQSASHGAGRAMSRRAALDRIAKAERDRYLREHGVTLLGGGLDESPQAYKRIERIIAAQSDLVDIIARFEPRVVRMASEPGDI